MTCVAHDEPGRRRCDACADYSAWRPRLACRVCGAANHCGECCENCLHKCNGGQMCSVGQPYNQLIARAEALEIKLTEQEEHMHEQHDTAQLAERIAAARVCDVNDQTKRWLVGTSATDLNFKSLLLAANAATIRAALAEIEGQHGHAGREKAMKAQLRKLLESEGDQVSATATRQERAVALNVGELEAERERQQELQAEQQDRERLIAQAHEVIGRVQSNLLMGKFATVSNLVHLKQIKESKIYRDLPMVGTWDKYCEYIGLSRQKVDEDLANLAAFGEDFLLTSRQFGLGYRELRQLRQLRYDGDSFSMSDDGKTVVIEGEAIALSDDAAPEIEAALEKLLEKNKALRERNGKLEKDLRGAVKEETAGLTSEKKALLERVQALEQYEPKADDREWAVNGMQRISDAAAALQLAIAGFLIDEHVSTDRHIQAQVDAHLREAELSLHDVRTRLDDTIGMFRD